MILVVDDDADIREGLADLLGEAGYQVRCASDGLDALKQLRSGERPQVILLDLMMPGMDGAAFRWEQLTYPTLADIPVILVTASSDCQRSATMLRTAGCISKPFEPHHLLAEVARVCAGG